MATMNYGPGNKKETVYSGPSPVMSGTVYGGPPMPGTTGTVYQGPSPGGTVYQTQVRNGQAARRVDPSANVRKAGALFYYIAGLSLINTLLALASARFAMAIGLGITRAFDASLSQDQIAVVLILNVLIAGVFVVIGMFARKGSSVAFLIGIVLYGLDMILLCTDFARHVSAVAVHAFFIFNMIRAWREL